MPKTPKTPPKGRNPDRTIPLWARRQARDAELMLEQLLWQAQVGEV